MTSDPLATIHPMSTDRVSFWEVGALGLGTIALVGAATIGLGFKLWTNMNESKRVEKIARHIVHYNFPKTGVPRMGLSIGAESFAVIADRETAPSLQLFLQSSPINPTDRTSEFVREMGLMAAWSGNWDDEMESRTVPYQYCNQSTELTIRQGNWAPHSKEESDPAIEYTLAPTIKQYNQTIRVLAIGPDAKKRADQVLKSIRCRG